MHQIFSKSFFYSLQARPVFIGNRVSTNGFNICAGLRHGRPKGMLFERHQNSGQWGCRFTSTKPVDAKELSLKRPRQSFNVSTFNPDHLQETDFIDLSSKLAVKFGPSGLRWTYDQIYKHGPFPPGSRGFFYYHKPSGLPDIAGEIRFRLTSTSTPASFHLGTDLTTMHGMPWRIQVLGTANTSRYRHMWDILLRDGLATPSMLIECQKYLPSRINMRGQSYLFALDQPFPFTFNKSKHTVWIVARGKLAKVPLERIFSQVEKSGYRRIFAGQATVCFELSRAPEHKGKVALLIRVLKIPGKIEYLVPNYEGHLQRPTEGSYLMIQYPGKEPELYCRVVQDKFRHIIEHFDDERHDSLLRLSSQATISTLDRKRLQPTDCVQLWRRQFLTIIPPKFAPIQVWFGRDYPSSPAFLYYHSPSGLPELAGEIRIRLTSSSDPSYFDNGADLIQREGMWKIPLLTIAANPSYTGLGDLLLHDRLVTPATLSACKRICDQLPLLSEPHMGRIILHHISQPFILNFTLKLFWVYVVSGNQVARCLVSSIRGHFSQGRAMLRFEPQPGSPRRLAIRVLQIIEPIRYTTTSADISIERTVTEGSLLHDVENGKLLTINIDGGQRIRSLALLWPDDLQISASSID